MDIQQNNGKQGVRTRHIDIRLTENEYEMIVEKAAECGLTLSNYGRKLLQNHHPNKRLSIIRKSKFPQNPKRSVRFSGKRTKRSVQKRKARNTQKAETKVL